MYGRGREPSRNPASHFSLFASGRFGQCAVYNQIGASRGEYAPANLAGRVRFERAVKSKALRHIHVCGVRLTKETRHRDPTQRISQTKHSGACTSPMSVVWRTSALRQERPFR